MKFDLDELNSNAINSAATLDRISQLQDEKLRSVAEEKRKQLECEERLVAGAEASANQNELLKKEMELVEKQNELLQNNYDKLEEMFNAQVEANIETKEELRRSKRFNLKMMIISTIAMIAAIAGPIATIWVSR